MNRFTTTEEGRRYSGQVLAQVVLELLRYKRALKRIATYATTDADIFRQMARRALRMKSKNKTLKQWTNDKLKLHAKRSRTRIGNAAR